MAVRIRFPEPMESTVRLIEETAPARLIAAARARMATTSPAHLATASVLAVCRSSEIQIDHHGGPLHPVAGLHALLDAGAHAGMAEVAALQSAALCNRHIHAPEGGPYEMPELSPKAVAPDAAAFLAALDHLLPGLAEKHLVALLAAGKRAEALGAMIEVAIRRQPIDDHYPIYLVHTMRTLDAIGWEWEEALLRPVARWLAMCPISVVRGDSESKGFREKLDGFAAYDSFAALAEPLLARPLRVESGPDEDKAVAALADDLARLEDFDAVPAPLAKAIGNGLSLAGACEALGLAGASWHVRTNYGNPLDTHIQNGIAARRYLIARADVSLRQKLAALLTWHTGPESRVSMGRMVHTASPAGEYADLPTAPAALLSEMERLIASRPADKEATKTGAGRGAMRCGPKERRPLAMADAFLAKGGAPSTLVAALARLVLRDDATELHSVSGFHDAVDLYETSRGPNRARHLISATKIVLLGHGFGQDVWAEAAPRQAAE